MHESRDRLIQLMRELNTIDSQYLRVRNSLDIKESLFVLLYSCYSGEPRSQKDICEEWHIPRTTLNTAVKEQEAAQHVKLVPCGNKQKLVTLTDSGRAYAERLMGPLLEAEKRASSCIDDELVEGLRRFGEHLGREFDKLDESAS